MADLIQMRRDTSSNWSNTNPTLADGEIGLETDTGKMKWGDGSTEWNSLSYKLVAETPTIKKITKYEEIYPDTPISILADGVIRKTAGDGILGDKITTNIVNISTSSVRTCKNKDGSQAILYKVDGERHFALLDATGLVEDLNINSSVNGYTFDDEHCICEFSSNNQWLIAGEDDNGHGVCMNIKNWNGLSVGTKNFNIGMKDTMFVVGIGGDAIVFNGDKAYCIYYDAFQDLIDVGTGFTMSGYTTNDILASLTKEQNYSIWNITLIKDGDTDLKYVKIDYNGNNHEITANTPVQLTWGMGGNFQNIESDHILFEIVNTNGNDYIGCYNPINSSERKSGRIHKFEGGVETQSNTMHSFDCDYQFGLMAFYNNLCWLKGDTEYSIKSLNVNQGEDWIMNITINNVGYGQKFSVNKFGQGIAVDVGGGNVQVYEILPGHMFDENYIGISENHGNKGEEISIKYSGEITWSFNYFITGERYGVGIQMGDIKIQRELASNNSLYVPLGTATAKNKLLLK